MNELALSAGPTGYFPGYAWQVEAEKRENWVREDLSPVMSLHPEAPAAPVVAASNVTVLRVDASAMETLALVRLIVTHPEVWPGYAHDFMGTPEEFVPPWLGQREVLVARKREQVIGVFMLTNFQAGIWIPHLAFFPWAAGRDVREAAHLCARMMFERPDCWMLVGLTAATNRPALYSSRRIGFRRVGVLPQATRIEGAWTDLVISQMTKADLP